MHEGWDDKANKVLVMCRLLMYLNCIVDGAKPSLNYHLKHQHLSAFESMHNLHFTFCVAIQVLSTIGDGIKNDTHH